MPLYDLHCEACHRDEELACPIAERQAQTCQTCGERLIVVLKPRKMKGFEPHFDIGIGRDVTGWGDVKKAMRENTLDFRDHPSAGDLSARKDRIEQQKRAR